jgi:hypothetical protein
LACVILVILELKIAISGIGSWQNVALCITYAYAMLLASLPLVSRGLQVSIHLNTVLLVSFGSYAYRDLFPLATFTLVPQDLAQGWLLWAKIVVLAVAAVVIPLSTPRPYIPLDPEVPTFSSARRSKLILHSQNPMVEPNPEQTASLFSSLTYSYLDSSILKSVVAARKQDGLTSEKLPALADYDRVEYLIRRSFHALDPLNEDASKHLLYGLLRVYRSYATASQYYDVEPACRPRVHLDDFVGGWECNSDISVPNVGLKFLY